MNKEANRKRSCLRRKAQARRQVTEGFFAPRSVDKSLFMIHERAYREKCFLRRMARARRKVTVGFSPSDPVIRRLFMTNGQTGTVVARVKCREHAGKLRRNFPRHVQHTVGCYYKQRNDQKRQLPASNGAWAQASYRRAFSAPSSTQTAVYGKQRDRKER